jgi:hypothetical protein
MSLFNILLSPLSPRAPLFGLLYRPRMMDDEFGEVDGMTARGKYII